MQTLTATQNALCHGVLQHQFSWWKFVCMAFLNKVCKRQIWQPFVLPFIDKIDDELATPLTDEVNEEAAAGQRLFAQGNHLAALPPLRRASALWRIIFYRCKAVYNTTHLDEISEVAVFLEGKINTRTSCVRVRLCHMATQDECWISHGLDGRWFSQATWSDSSSTFSVSMTSKSISSGFVWVGC